MTDRQFAAFMGCTEAQVKALRAKNAAQLRSMAAQARRTGKNVNGYTASQLADMAQKHQPQPSSH